MMVSSENKIYAALCAVIFVLIVVGVVCQVYGLILAFSASILLGVVVLILEPMPLVIGLVKIVAGIDLAQRIVEWVSK